MGRWVWPDHIICCQNLVFMVVWAAGSGLVILSSAFKPGVKLVRVEGLIDFFILLLSVVVIEVAAYSVDVILCCDISCGKGQVNQYVRVVCGEYALISL